jgi:6-phosphofructokinase 1
MPSPSRIAIVTPGGDCPGLNAVIRAVTRVAIARGLEVVGVLDGFLGLIEDRTTALTDREVSGILTRGGTILGASNKADPRRFCTSRDAAGKPVFEDVTARCLATIERHRLDALIIAGGDGSLAAAMPLIDAGTNCIAIPKTIDNDIQGTDLSFGFLTAVATATEALDRVHTTAASHHRAIAVEVMGRNAGWIALHAGIASGCEVILLPEIPYSLDKVGAAIEARRRRGKRFSVLCIAEGARPAGGEQVVTKVDPSSPDPVRLGGISRIVAEEIEQRTGIESRYVVLGHVQRGGAPIPADRILATQFGQHAVELFLSGARDRMVALSGLTLADVPIREVAGRQRLVPADHSLIAAARAMSVSFGD